MTAGQSKELGSSLGILRELNLNQLIEVQYDLTREIERRVKMMQNDTHQPTKLRSVSHQNTSSSRHSITKGDVDGLVAGKENYEGPVAVIKSECKSNLGEELVATQINHFSTKPATGTRQQCSHECSSQPDHTDDSMLPGTLDMQSKEIDFSSPLRGCQAANISTAKSGPIKRALAIISDSEGELDWSDSEYVDSVKEGKKLKIENPNQVKMDFNINPITNKPWIYEDFRLNENFNYQRGRKNIDNARLSRFYSVAGKPENDSKLILNPKTGFELIKREEDNESNGTYNGPEFYNLSTRSKSPPGYGRLDFPNTQENLADKQKAQEIIYKKTKERFLIATNHLIPAEKRQFLFRNEKLNEMVTKEQCRWQENMLQIFSRE